MIPPKRKPVFIEKIMPVTPLNEQVDYEQGGNPFNSLHRWYSRQPLSFSRASVLGSPLAADVTIAKGAAWPLESIRRFLKSTGLLGNALFMRSWEVALKVIPRIGDERKRIPAEKALADLWLAMDESNAKVVYVQPKLD